MNEILDGVTTILFCGLGCAGAYSLIESFRQTDTQREQEKKQEAAAREFASSTRFMSPDIEWLNKHVGPPDAVSIERGKFIEQERWTR